MFTFFRNPWVFGKLGNFLNWKIHYLGNFPDSQAIGEFPRFPKFLLGI